MFNNIVGGLSLSFLGKRILKLLMIYLKEFIFKNHSAILQMTETFSNKDDNKKSVVLIEYPRKGVWAVGLLQKKIKVRWLKKLEKIC